mmetsp:Transcript_96532/g.259563  ORF Transcript_96532/g.259563 Transcript_96532/m.259563 type:complete len:194 (+) Transcript_96532:1-582(+)
MAQLAVMGREILDLAAEPAEKEAAPAQNATAAQKAAPPVKTFAKNAAVSQNRTEALMVQHDALKNMLAHLKSSIKNMNKQEAEGKVNAKKQIEKLQQRLVSEQQKLKQSGLSDFDHELLVNRTRTDEKELEYWTRSRDLQHGMFHSSLKMTHGLMSKANAVIEAYNTVLATGKLSPELAKQLEAVSTQLPKKH